MKKNFVTFLAGGVAACGLMTTTALGADYIIGSQGNKSSNLEAAIAAAGGSVKNSFDFGLTVASSENPDFVDDLYNESNVQFVVEDFGFDVEAVEQIEFSEGAGTPPNSGDDDFFFDLQWGHNYVGAQESWAKGFRGQGVRVAVLDGGFEPEHPDLAPNVVATYNATDVNFRYGCPGDAFSHGNHVAGTVAAADNGFGAIGVAPEADLMLVKVLSESPASGCRGSGSFADIIEGIVWAADNGAHVINMSLGAFIPRQGAGGANSDLSALKNAVNKAVTYANKKGVTVIVSGGNDGQDVDGGTNSTINFNAAMSHAVGISALTTLNWAGNPDQEELVRASYSNYGTSQTDFGAPGGSTDYQGNEICQVSFVVRPCFVFDLVFSVGSSGSWYWSAGTSMSSPHAAGVAALIISETGDSRPSHVLREMRKRSVDMGKPGRDDDFGHGTANTGN